MTKLVVRKIPWEFDESVPFMWQPAHPDFGLFCNTFTTNRCPTGPTPGCVNTTAERT